MQGDVDAWREVRDAAVAVERDDLRSSVGEIIGEESAAGAEAVAGEGRVDVNLEDVDFEDIAGLGLGDGDGAGEDVTAGTLVLDLVEDGMVIGRNVGVLVAFRFRAPIRSPDGEGLDADQNCGINREDK